MFEDVELEWYFCTLSILANDIGRSWSVVMRVNDNDADDVSWYVVPYEYVEPDETADLSLVENHPDRLVLELKDGILFTRPTKTARSQWMAIQLKEQPELAGRII